ncbi:hypothetical protein HK101_000979, partial [Irineochytrium annulatum]
TATRLKSLVHIVVESAKASPGAIHARALLPETHGGPLHHLCQIAAQNTKSSHQARIAQLALELRPDAVAIAGAQTGASKATTAASASPGKGLEKALLAAGVVGSEVIFVQPRCSSEEMGHWERFVEGPRAEKPIAWRQRAIGGPETDPLFWY